MDPVTQQLLDELGPPPEVTSRERRAAEVGLSCERSHQTVAAHFELEAGPEAARATRSLVRRVLLSWGREDLVERAELIAGELVANAALHARGVCQLDLELTGLGSLRLSVRDSNSGMPAVAASTEDAPSGRGLTLVAKVATAWGAEQTSNGKVVWAELGGPSSATVGARVAADEQL